MAGPLHIICLKKWIKPLFIKIALLMLEITLNAFNTLKLPFKYVMCCFIFLFNSSMMISQERITIKLSISSKSISKLDGAHYWNKLHFLLKQVKNNLSGYSFYFRNFCHNPLSMKVTCATKTQSTSTTTSILTNT